ncbi:MAG: Spo0E family sporulation regulatory protein-aspartic acid phosphatase [Clostridia bacterium]|nr:Spo0E family sporulation regulatory protein-aspartic acid phosphatase [Clostridia bacterium]
MKGANKMSPELEKLRDELEIAVNDPNMDFDEITKISCKIDEELSKLYLNKENEGIDYDKNYKDILERKDKEELLNLISKDLTEKFSMNKLSKFDVSRTANGIYDFCCLTVHGVSEGDIAHFIVRKGWYYNDFIPEEEDKTSLTTNEKYLEIIKDLQDKYIEILKIR